MDDRKRQGEIPLCVFLLLPCLFFQTQIYPTRVQKGLQFTFPSGKRPSQRVVNEVPSDLCFS